MDTHVDMLVCRIENARSFAQLLRGVRRSRELVYRHSLVWAVVRDMAFGRARAQRERKRRAFAFACPVEGVAV